MRGDDGAAGEWTTELTLYELPGGSVAGSYISRSEAPAPPISVGHHNQPEVIDLAIGEVHGTTALLVITL